MSAARRGCRAAWTVLAVALLLSAGAEAAAARQWAWLGVRIRDISEQEMNEISSRHGIREGFGVMIVEIIRDAPAAAAGLRAGDLVVAFGDRPVTDTRLLQRLVASATPGSEARLTVLREAGRQRVAVRLGVMPRAVVGERVAAELGFVVREPDPPGALRREGSIAPAISAVLEGGPAERAGLEVGDVILQVNEEAVVSREAAREALAEASLDRPVRLTIRRGERHLSVTLEVRR